MTEWFIPGTWYTQTSPARHQPRHSMGPPAHLSRHRPSGNAQSVQPAHAPGGARAWLAGRHSSGRTHRYSPAISVSGITAGSRACEERRVGRACHTRGTADVSRGGDLRGQWQQARRPRRLGFPLCVPRGTGPEIQCGEVKAACGAPRCGSTDAATFDRGDEIGAVSASAVRHVISARTAAVGTCRWAR